jgi:hypothetical protein
VAPGGTRIYIGAANGGVWRSDDTGQTWRSLMEAFDLNPTTPASDSLSVGAIAIDLANPDRVYVGSGEGAGAAYFGVGPIVTNNGTAIAPAWTTEQAAPGSPSLAGTAFYALAVDPANPDRVVAGTRNGVYRREPNGTGGFHWAQKVMGTTTWGSHDVLRGPNRRGYADRREWAWHPCRRNRRWQCGDGGHRPAGLPARTGHGAWSELRRRHPAAVWRLSWMAWRRKQRSRWHGQTPNSSSSQGDPKNANEVSVRLRDPRGRLLLPIAVTCGGLRERAMSSSSCRSRCLDSGLWR